jgi:pimeloyl-ACP methyl ester carboxylesterase
MRGACYDARSHVLGTGLRPRHPHAARHWRRAPHLWAAGGGLRYRAVAWDAPGYGRSAPIEPYNFKGLANSCIALMEALLQKAEQKQIILLGHSMGGMVAQEVIARRPDLVSRLILSGTSPAFGKADGAWQQAFIAERTQPCWCRK